MKKLRNPIPTNGIILENERGEILLVKRNKKPKFGYWDLPGGFVDIGESMEESMIREVKEELEIRLKDFNYFMSYPDNYFYKGEYEKIIGFIFAGRIGNQRMRPASDVSSYKFFPKDKIPFERIAFSGLIKALKKYVATYS